MNMSVSLDEVEQQARMLPPDERARLAAPGIASRRVPV